MNRKPISPEKAALRMAALCARAEHCEFEIDRKLFRQGLTPTQRKEIIDFLRDQKYLDDERFAKSFTNDKARFALWGPYKIKNELRQRKISSEFISKAINEVDEEIWNESITRIAHSKSRNLDLMGEEGHNNCMRIYRYLLSRGFGSSESIKTIKSIIRERKNNEGENLE